MALATNTAARSVALSATLSLLNGGHRGQTPSRSAVEIVERFAVELQRAAGSWEATSREIDEIIGKLCDPNPPVSLVDLEKYLLDNGFEVILAGESRTPESIEQARRELGHSDSSE